MAVGGLGFLLRLAHDGVEGELARVNGRASHRGAALDTLRDRYADLAVVSAWSSAPATPRPPGPSSDRPHPEHEDEMPHSRVQGCHRRPRLRSGRRIAEVDAATSVALRGVPFGRGRYFNLRHTAASGLLRDAPAGISLASPLMVAAGRAYRLSPYETGFRRAGSAES
jgi:hypothetical protein